MKKSEELAAIFEELQIIKERLDKIESKRDQNEKNILEQILANQTLLETINEKSKPETSSETPSIEIDTDKMKLLGNDICQQMERQIWTFKNEKNGMFISNKLSLLLMAMVLCTFFLAATSLFLWQKKSYEADVWKNTAETHFEQYQSLKKER